MKRSSVKAELASLFDASCLLQWMTSFLLCISSGCGGNRLVIFTEEIGIQAYN